VRGPGCLLAALALAGPAAGQTPKAVAPASAAEIAAAKAHADRIITAAHAENLFVNVTTGGVATVRHRASGLECGFDPDDDKGLVSVFENAQVPRGDDVGCSGHLAGTLISTFVTRYPEAMTPRQVVEDSVGAIRRQFTDLKDWSGQSVSITQKTKPGEPAPTPSVTIRLAANFQGQPKFTRSSAAACGRWIVAQRVTDAADKAMAADLAAELTLRAAIDSVCKAQTPWGPTSPASGSDRSRSSRRSSSRRRPSSWRRSSGPARAWPCRSARTCRWRP
jgi:hypothetical protein